MTTATLEANESAILARVIAPGGPTLSAAVASELLSWGFTNDDRSRMNELASKAREGSLSEPERIEAEGFERVSSFLGIVKSKARQSLRFQSET